MQLEFGRSKRNVADHASMGIVDEVRTNIFFDRISETQTVLSSIAGKLEMGDRFVQVPVWKI